MLSLIQVVKRIPYRGPQIQTLAALTGMVACDKLTGKCYLLAIQVPGMLENRPVVVFGSRVHITYKVRPSPLALGRSCGAAAKMHFCAIQMLYHTVVHTFLNSKAA